MFFSDSIVAKYRESRRSAIRNGVADIKLSISTGVPEECKALLAKHKLREGDYTEIYLKDIAYSTPLGRSLIETPINLDKFIELTIIEDPYYGPSKMAQILVEDKNKDVALFQVGGLEETTGFLDEFPFGSIIKVTGPCVMPTLLHGRDVSKTALEISDPEKITLIGKKKDMCRYCKMENASQKCSVCKRLYCSKECQVTDWKRQKHRVICETPISY